ncbi:AraC family transcriptional regulator [Sphingobacterium oryzagri]|uniref:AraC family transcriptional regulator n=1 Tax=Sphingobacterium oryzagri TaxID=3025669 RepID=A0ABY7WQN8_9SPHI|nr:AraC family transcriptional regulator [Sphingobacterium sp. KACC 22765]WDF70721.1 AraC family transcriptional regulator [Sphingobacterium sp. KACC 22765]
MHGKSKLTGHVWSIFDLDFKRVVNQTDYINEHVLVKQEANSIELCRKMLYKNGLCIIDLSMYLHEGATDTFHIEGEHIIYTFFINGNSYATNQDGSGSYDITIGMGHRRYTGDFNIHVDMKPDNDVRYFAIFMTKAYYLNLLDNEKWATQDALFRSVKKNEMMKSRAEYFNINHAMINLLFNMDSQASTIDNRTHFIELKLKQLFLSVQDSLLHGITSFTELREDVHVLQKLHAYLTVNYVAPPTLKELARQFFLNEKKMTSTFKAKYGLTIHGYVTKLRMEKAQSLLLEGKPIKVITLDLGYQSISHFIKTFKSYYGFTPTLVKKRVHTMKSVIPLLLFVLPDHALALSSLPF